MFVAGEFCKVAYHAPIDIALIVKDSSPSRPSSDKVNMAYAWRFRWHVVRSVLRTQKRKVDFKPWILVPANDNAGPIDVEKEDL
jgi:hypothetical protein